MIDQLYLSLDPVIAESFTMMLGMDVSPSKDWYVPADGEKVYTAMIGLSSEVSVGLHIHCPEFSAVAFTQAMLGTSDPPEECTVVDALGEIANLMGGGLKNAFAPMKEATLSLPSVVGGRGFQICPPRGAELRNRGYFASGNPFDITLFYKP